MTRRGWLKRLGAGLLVAVASPMALLAPKKWHSIYDWCSEPIPWTPVPGTKVIMVGMRIKPLPYQKKALEKLLKPSLKAAKAMRDLGIDSPELGAKDDESN